MAELAVRRREEPLSAKRLESWKEIAAYLNRHVTTVRRWERNEGLPVHRHMHSELGSVYAYAGELDIWIDRRRGTPERDQPREKAAMPVAAPAIGLPIPAGLRVREGSVRLLGREVEMHTLSEVWSKARAGQQQLIVISGEPGTGKTRLVSEFARLVTGAGDILGSRCDRPPHLPFGPFVEILENIVIKVGAARLRNLFAGIEASSEFVHLMPKISALGGTVSKCPPASPEGHRFRMFEAFVGLISAMAREAPILLIIEDVHWADEASLLLLRHLVRSSRDAALCIIVTCCEPTMQQDRWRAEVLSDLRKEALTTRVELGEFSEESIRCYVDEWIARSAPASLVRFVTESAQGNPLFIEEMLRHLHETGSVNHLLASHRNGDLSKFGVPKSIQEVINRRISRLSPACRQLLMVASVAGRSFNLTIAEDVTEMRESVLLDAVEEAVAANILREVAEVPGQFSFAHALVREVLYLGQTAVRRLRLHHRLAEAIERRSDPSNLPVLELAYHFGHAAAHSDVQKALNYAVLAAEHATAILAMEEAARCYEVALDAIEFLSPNADTRSQRFVLHGRRGSSFFQAGHWASAKNEFEKAIKLTDNVEERSELHVKLAEVSFWLMDLPAVRRYAKEAGRLADLAERSDLAADALAWSASTEVSNGNISGAIQMDRRAVARAGGIRSFGLARAPLTLYWAGQTAEAIAGAHQAVERARESDDPAFLLYALQHLGLALSGLGQYDDAIGTFDEACHLGRQCGGLPLLARAMSMSVAPLFSLGDFQSARTRALEARELARRVDFEPALVSAGIDLLLISARLHEPGCESLLRETQTAVLQARDWHAWKWRLRLAEVQAELALACGRWNEAVIHASQVVSQSRYHSRPKYQALGLAVRARAGKRLGQSQARRDARAGVEIARRLGDPAVLLECLSASLQIEGSDELRIEAQRTLQRITASSAGPSLATMS
jgi:tetratricopeptide (TPR) repeat protein